MNKKLIRKWVRALESGKWKQGKYELVSNDQKRFCCLGVLACMAGVKKKDIYKISRKKGNMILGRKFLCDNGIANDINQDKLGFMNDHGESGFKTIAKWIRKNILKEE